MRIQVFSDLHADVAAVKPIAVGASVDVVVVAGDTCQGAREAFEQIRRIVPMTVPVIMTMGNHEYYGRCLPEELAIARATAPSFGIHLLDNDAVAIDGVRFVGCTLWTDYRLFGSANLPFAMRAATQGLNDHRRIAWSKRPWARFQPAEALLMHSRSRMFLQATLQAQHAGPTLVITHHAPHRAAIERLEYIGQNDRDVFAFTKRLIQNRISPQAIPSIIGATENRRFTELRVFSFIYSILHPDCTVRGS